MDTTSTGVGCGVIKELGIAGSPWCDGHSCAQLDVVCKMGDGRGSDTSETCIGLELNTKFEVQNVIANSACARCGVIQRGDVLVEIDGLSTEGRNLSDIIQQISGLSGKQVELIMRCNTSGKRKSVAIALGPSAGVGLKLSATTAACSAFKRCYQEVRPKLGACKLGTLSKASMTNV